jgi:glycerate kinase
MRILVAADSFKDALPAADVCAAIAAGLRQRDTPLSITEFPLADGGEGTGEILRRHFQLDVVTVETLDARLKPITAQFGIARDKSIAIVELASASGLQLLEPHQRNPLSTSTLGTGKLIDAAISAGAQQIVLCIGGSATNDGGIGIATALGWRFLDAANRDIVPVGGNLLGIRTILPPAREIKTPVDVLCDVTNPLTGTNGATQIYARQKGADDFAVQLLETGLTHLSTLVREQQISIASPDDPGAGAAGGVGYGAKVFLNAQLHRGIEYILNAVNFDTALADVDVVITGEGRLDAQTAHGKLIQGVCQRAKRLGKPVIALCGEVLASAQELNEMGLQRAVCINDGLSMQDALERTEERLVRAAKRLELEVPSP